MIAAGMATGEAKLLPSLSYLVWMAPILQPTEGSLDGISRRGRRRGKGMEALAGGVVWNDQQGAPRGKERTQGVAVIGRVGQELG